MFVGSTLKLFKRTSASILISPREAARPATMLSKLVFPEPLIGLGGCEDNVSAKRKQKDSHHRGLQVPGAHDGGGLFFWNFSPHII
jgi:hypothetical protein